MRNGPIAAVFLLSSLVLGAGPGLGGPSLEAARCRLALVLAVDVSSSVDASEDRLQRAGIAAALRAPDVARAFLGAPGSVALHAFEWSGSHHQATLLDWTRLDTHQDLERAASIIDGSPRRRDDLPTAIGTALGHAATALLRGPDCAFRKVDVSGDGISNDGYPPASAYGAFDFSSTTVNGLVILGAGSDNEVDLVEYYRAEVLRGPGAFLEVAADFDDFTRAIRRKLVREVSAPALSETEGASPFGTGVHGG